MFEIFVTLLHQVDTHTPRSVKGWRWLGVKSQCANKTDSFCEQNTHSQIHNP